MATGYFDSNGDPWLEIEISGPFSNPSKTQCLIDTGFTGFLSMPFLSAFPLGLILTGTMNIVFANGDIQPRLTCLGKAIFDGQTNVGVIVLEPQGNQVLLGMNFLRKFGMRLNVDPGESTVELLPSPIPTLPIQQPLVQPNMQELSTPPAPTEQQH